MVKREPMFCGSLGVISTNNEWCLVRLLCFLFCEGAILVYGSVGHEAIKTRGWKVNEINHEEKKQEG